MAVETGSLSLERTLELLSTYRWNKQVYLSPVILPTWWGSNIMEFGVPNEC